MNAWKTFFLQTFESIRSELKCQQLRWRGHQPLDPSTTAASFVAEEEKELSSVTLISMHQPTWRKYLQFVGPGYLIAVGYMDPVRLFSFRPAFEFNPIQRAIGRRISVVERASDTSFSL